MLAECCTVVGVSPVSTERRLCRVEWQTAAMPTAIIEQRSTATSEM